MNLIMNFILKADGQTGSISPYIFIAIVGIAIIALLIAYFFPAKTNWVKKRVSAIREHRSRAYLLKAMGDKKLQKEVLSAGYAYDPAQNIFYSVMYPWQREYGYSRLFDEACAPLGMIVDCEPVYFYYGGKNWLIEFWKGQYDLPTGCEVGVYTKKGPPLENPASARYDCANDFDRLYISYILKKNGKTMFKREGRHWWLTGFLLGEFSEPSELVMNIYITLKNQTMRDLFVKGLEKAGYTEKEYLISGNTVGIRFDKPHTKQPLTRTGMTDRLIQRKNYALCKSFIDVTSGYEKHNEKMGAIAEKSPELLEYIVRMGKPHELFKSGK